MQRGFTLIELVIVLAIIFIIAAIVFPAMKAQDESLSLRTHTPSSGPSQPLATPTEVPATPASGASQ